MRTACTTCGTRPATAPTGRHLRTDGQGRASARQDRALAPTPPDGRDLSGRSWFRVP